MHHTVEEQQIKPQATLPRLALTTGTQSLLNLSIANHVPTNSSLIQQPDLHKRQWQTHKNLVNCEQVSQKKVDIVSTRQMFLQLYEGLVC